MISRHNIVLATRGIQHLSRQSLWKEACALHADMIDVGVEPDVVSFTVTLASLRETGLWRDAMTLHQNIMDLRIQTNVIPFNTVISSCWIQWETALAVLNRMFYVPVRPDDVSCNAATRWSFESFHLLTVCLKSCDLDLQMICFMDCGTA